MENKFKIGDRVKCIKSATFAKVGEIGTVKMVCSSTLIIRWDNNVGGWENIPYNIEDGHGEYVNFNKIAHLTNNKLTTNDKLIFRDNATILIKDGKRYVAKCCKGDTYDREKGLLSVLAKAHGYTFNNLQEMLKSAEIQGEKSEVVKQEKGKFNIDDYVYIKDEVFIYSTYRKWFEKYAPTYKNKYAFGTYVREINNIFKIVAVGKHEACNRMLYAIEDLKDGTIFLIGEEGINKAKEVKRKAKIGEYIKVVKCNDIRYDNGDIFKVKNCYLNGNAIVYKAGTKMCIWVEEYVVLEKGANNGNK